MDYLERILRSPYLTPPMQEAVGDAFSRLWALCGNRFDYLPREQLDRAQQRLAAFLVLMALSSEPTTCTAEQLAGKEIVDLICTTNLLLTDCRVLDLRDLAPK